MIFIFKESLFVEDYSLNLFTIHGKAFINFPEVLKGYMFNFTLEKNQLVTNTALSISYHSKYKIVDSLEVLKEKLEFLKETILKFNKSQTKYIDQFSYINAFIFYENKKYTLCLSSDTFDLLPLLKTII